MNDEKSGAVGLIDLVHQHLYRTILCDLLTGRVVRGYAQESLNKAVALDETCKALSMFGSPYQLVNIEEYLDNAVELEYIARDAEQGKVPWGGRWNRCGYEPETDEVDIDLVHHLVKGL